jgi:hypothetical protein
MELLDSFSTYQRLVLLEPQAAPLAKSQPLSSRVKGLGIRVTAKQAISGPVLKCNPSLQFFY